MTREAKPMEAAVESYWKQHGSYPESLEAAGLPYSEHIFYQRKDDGSYILWFGLELGESRTFHSGSRRWD